MKLKVEYGLQVPKGWQPLVMTQKRGTSFPAVLCAMTFFWIMSVLLM
jgi:hypothetical protein